MKGIDKGKPMVAAPGELYSSAVDNILASAEQIYDYTKEKTQEEINTELYELAEASHQEIDTYSKEEIDEKLTSKSGEISAAYDSSVAHTDSEIQELNTTLREYIHGVEQGASGAINVVDEKVDSKVQEINNTINTLEQNIANELSEITDDYNSRATVKFDSIISQANILQQSTASDTVTVHYVSQNKTFVARPVGTVGTSVCYANWKGRELYCKEALANPYSEKVYICNGTCYIWNNNELQAIGGDVIIPTPGPSESTEIPTITRGALNSLRSTDGGTYYTVTDTTNGVTYKIGNLFLLSNPSGITQVLFTNIKNFGNSVSDNYDSDTIYTYVRTYSDGAWSATWFNINLEGLADKYIDKTTGVFIADSINGNSVASGTIDASKLSPELLSTINQINTLNNLSDQIKTLETKTKALSTSINSITKLTQQSKMIETAQDGFFVVDENGNIGSCITPNGTWGWGVAQEETPAITNNNGGTALIIEGADFSNDKNFNINNISDATALSGISLGDPIIKNNTITFTANKIPTNAKGTIQWTLTNTDAISLKSESGNTRVYDINNSANNSPIQLQVSVVEKPSYTDTYSGTVTYKIPETASSSQITSVDIVFKDESNNSSSVIEGQQFELKANVLPQDVEILSYSWTCDSSNVSLENASGEICKVNIKNTVTSNSNIIVRCSVTGKNNTVTSSKTISIKYKDNTSEQIPFYKITKTDKVIVSKTTQIPFTKIPTNADGGLDIWNVEKGPASIDVYNGVLYLDDDAQANDEIIISVHPAKYSTITVNGQKIKNYDYMTLQVASDYNVELEDLTIDVGNGSFTGTKLPLRVIPDPDIPKFHNVTWSLEGAVPKGVSIQQDTGNLIVTDMLRQGNVVTVKATSNVANKSAEAIIRVEYGQDSGTEGVKGINIAYNVGGSAISFHADGITESGYVDIDDKVTWELIEVVDGNTVQQAVSNSSNTLAPKVIAKMIPVNGTKNATMNINGESIAETSLYAVPNFDTTDKQKILVENYARINGLTIDLEDEQAVSNCFNNNVVTTSYTEFTDLTADDVLPKRTLLKTAGNQLFNPELDGNTVNLVWRETGNAVKNAFTIRCTYTNGDTSITKDQYFEFYGFGDDAYIPVTSGNFKFGEDGVDVIKVDSSNPEEEVYRITDNSPKPKEFYLYKYIHPIIPEDSNLRESQFVVANDTWGLEFDFDLNNCCYQKGNSGSRMTIRDNINSQQDKLTVYFRMRCEQIPTPRIMMNSNPIIIFNRNVSTPSDFNIICENSYTSNVNGAILDGVQFTSQDSYGNPISATYQIISGNQYCSILSNGTGFRIFDTSKKPQYVTVQATSGNKTATYTFTVQLIS